MTEDSTPPEKFIYPGPIWGQKGSVPTPEKAPNYEAVCTMPRREAKAFCRELELHGLPCHLGSVGETRDDAEVAVYVAEEYLETARQVLKGELKIDPAELEENDLERDQIYAAQWICPHCRKHTLEALPLPLFWQRLQRVSLAVFFLPFVVMFIVWLVPLKPVTDAVNRIPEQWAMIWLLAVGAMVIPRMVVHRDRYCHVCGWRSTSDEVKK